MGGEGEGGEAGGFAGLVEGAGVGADLFGGDVEAGMGTGGDGEFLTEGDEVAVAITEGGDFGSGGRGGGSLSGPSDGETAKIPAVAVGVIGAAQEVGIAVAILELGEGGQKAGMNPPAAGALEGGGRDGGDGVEEI